VRPADIDDQNFLLFHDRSGGALIGTNLMDRDFLDSADGLAWFRELSRK
jgi:hypothetical protein